MSKLIDDGRMADKLRQAFTMDLIASAQRALEDRGVVLTTVLPETPAETYDETRDTPLNKYGVWMLLGILAGVFLLRR